MITFTEADVPSPSAISFASDIPSLNRMWDDTSPYWDGNSKLVILGHPIALVYWKDIYTSKMGVSWKPKQWKGTKGKWFEWKVSKGNGHYIFWSHPLLGSRQALVTRH